jgi:hypothetical protein
MRKLNPTVRKPSRQQPTKDHRHEEVIAGIWLVFYGLAIGVAVLSPFAAIQVAATAH